MLKERTIKGVTEQVIADVRGRASILEVISETVVLKRTGKEHKGLCPFHGEKTPSFNVNPEKGIFKCFGCGEGGDVFAFMQRLKGIDFIESVRVLAHKYGVRLVETEDERREYDKRTQMLLLCRQAAEYFSRMLEDPTEGMIGREYLSKRGVSDEIISKFKLGYAPNSWDGLLRHLTQSRQIAPQTLEEAGLVRRRPDSNSYYDLFRNRLMIPICDDKGDVIAFGGRTLGDDQVKYLNSPETPIYTKGLHLFGLHQAKESIKHKDSVIVVEGYFDAITPHQFGFTNTVATLGTALTEHQAKLLMRYTDSKRVYLSFDADAAGVKAVDRGVESLNKIAEGIGIELRVIRLPGGKDPDECLRDSNHGPDAFAQAIENARILIDYKLHRALDGANLTTHSGRIEASQKLVLVLAQIENAVPRGEYIRQWAMKLGVREEELLSDVQQYRAKNKMGAKAYRPEYRRPGAHSGKSTPIAGYVDAERQLLALYLTSREDWELATRYLLEGWMLTKTHRRIKESLDGIGSQFSTVEDLRCHLMDRLGPDKDASSALVEIILKVEDMRKQNVPAAVVLKEAMATILRERLNQEQTKARNMLATAADESEQQALQSKILELARMATMALPSANSIERLEELKRKIDHLTDAGS